MSLLLLHFLCRSSQPMQTRLRGCRGGGSGGERVRDFRMAANRSRRVMRKCQTCIQPMVKGAHHALVSCNNNERESGRENGKKNRDFDLVRIYKQVQIGKRTFSQIFCFRVMVLGWRPLPFNLSPAPGPKWDVPSSPMHGS